jgi:hypothetical protein
MDAARVNEIQHALSHTTWWRAAARLGEMIRRTPGPGHLLLVGTPRVEPWHLAAHLDDEARLTGLTQLSPQLVRWRTPTSAPAHLSFGLGRLEQARRDETVFVVAPHQVGAPLLERVNDARRAGATILSLDDGDSELGELVHERMTLGPNGLYLPDDLFQRFDRPNRTPDPDPTDCDLLRPDRTGADLPDCLLTGLQLPQSFDIAQHLVSAAAGTSAAPGRPSWRRRLQHALEAISGPDPRRGLGER